MSNWSAKQKFIATLFGGLLIFSGIVFFAVKPLLADLSDLHKRTQEQKNLLSDLILEESSFKTARENFSKIEGRAQEIDGLFPVRENLVGHIQRLEEIAKNFQDEFTLSITEPAEQAPVKKSKPKTAETENAYEVVAGLKKIEVIPYDFQLEGTFLGIINFLQTLENQPFYSEVESILLKSEGKSSGQSQAVGVAGRTGTVLASIRSAFYAKK